jgi:hypothetical protein
MAEETYLDSQNGQEVPLSSKAYKQVIIMATSNRNYELQKIATIY